MRITGNYINDRIFPGYPEAVLIKNRERLERLERAARAPAIPVEKVEFKKKHPKIPDRTSYSSFWVTSLKSQ